MKKSFIKLCLFSFSMLLLFSHFSCENSEEIYQQERSFEDKSGEIVQRGKGGNCTVDYNDMDIRVLWSDDCSTAKIILALCCNCPSQSGVQNSCTVIGGNLEMQTEECPFDFYYYNYTIPSTTLSPNTCIPIVFDIENKGCDVAFVSQLWLDGNSLTVDSNYESPYCPY